MVLELVPAVTRQFDMLLPRNEEKQESVMAALDKVNRKYGDNTLFYAATGIRREWKMLRQMKSPHYTTQWDELPVAV